MLGLEYSSLCHFEFVGLLDHLTHNRDSTEFLDTAQLNQCEPKNLHMNTHQMNDTSQWEKGNDIPNPVKCI